MNKEIIIEPCLGISLNLNEDKDSAKSDDKDADKSFESIFQTEIRKYEGSI